jgi:small subunit ribosomal protein S20
VARKSRTWKGARTPQALKRVRQELRRRAINRRARSEAKTLVQQATNIALGRAEGDGPLAIAAAISALDKAAEKGILHPNNAARRKSRLMAKANAAHLLDTVEAEGPVASRKKSAATKTAQRKKVAASKASKAAAAKAADRPRTAAGKAKVAVTRATRESAAARRRAQTDEPDEAPPES